MGNYNGYRMYTNSGYYGQQGEWQQSHLLAAELYGDFRARDGGLEAFLKDLDEHASIVVPISKEIDQMIQKHSLKVLASLRGYYFLSH